MNVNKTDKKVSISKGNDKMGLIPSISLPAVTTCIQCECNKLCYAARIERIRKNVRESYKRNLQILNKDPEIYWRQVEASIMLNTYFRFHVSGDIPNQEYFIKMVEVAKRNTHCNMLCFTKKYQFVNQYLQNGNQLPHNLHIIFSAWRNLDMKNPYNLPEAHVRYKDGTTTALESAVNCNGNCTDCAITDSGCWTLKNGEQIIFQQH